MKKIMLINPPNIMPADSIRRLAEPMGLLYLGASLTAAGYEVDLFDMTCEGYDNYTIENETISYGSSLDDLRNRVIAFKPDFVGISCLFSSRINHTMALCRELHGFGDERPIIAVGSLIPSLQPEKFLTDDLADYVVMGEGERRLPQLLDNLSCGRTPESGLDGLAYRRTNGQFFIVPAMKIINDLDSLPKPDRHMIDMEKYFKVATPFGPFSRSSRVGHILCTRGCPQNCNFCASVNYWGRRLRKRSIDNIMAEVKGLVDDFGIEEIQFVDDNLTADIKLAAGLFESLKQFKLKWCTPNGLYLNSLDESLIELMAQSGAYQLTFAVENASERVLRDIISKKVDLNKVKSLVAAAHAHNISVHGTFIIGFPGETRKEMETTLRFPYEAEFDSVSFFIAAPLPGSRLYMECLEKGYLGNAEATDRMNFKTANIQIPQTSPDYVMEPDEMERMVDSAVKDFNLWAEKRFPERHAEKFKTYLTNHPDDGSKISGRIT